VQAPDSKSILKTLRAVRLQMMLSNFYRWYARWTIFFLALIVVVVAWKWAAGTLRLRMESLPAMSLWVLIPPFAGGIVCSGIMALAFPPTLREAARAADAIWDTDDRFVTAIDFLGRKTPTDFEKLALAECAQFVNREKRTAEVPPPAELRWVVVPIVMIAILSWDSVREESAAQALVEASTRETSGTVRKLDKLAVQLEKKSAAEDEARKLAERLRKAAEQLRAEAKEGRDGEKAALRELSKLEQLVNEMRQQHAATPEELKALAEALAKHDETKDAAEEMKHGNFAEAAKKLDEAANNPETAAAAEKSLERAVEHLAQQKEQLSKQMEQLRDNARQSAASGERKELLKQLSEALNELQKQGKFAKSKDGKPAVDKGEGEKQPQQGGGEEMSDEELKRMLGALQNMKNNDSPGDGDGDPQPGDDQEGEGQIRLSNFGGKNPGSDQPGDGEKGEQAPTGQPGDKDEKGTTKDPFGQNTAAGKAGKDEGLNGRLGAGESLSAMVPSAPGADEKSKRRYRELYQSAAAVAEDAVVQESIPLGARFMIKRYFESIRPTER
jgi:plasmid stabilization system protein ParE